MEYRSLGNTDIKVSVIGFGAWGIGGLTEGASSYGASDDSSSLLALNTALDHGINFYDTSNVYGNGHSEYLLGQAFKSVRDEVVISSKVGLATFEKKISMTARNIRLSVEGSLRRLQTDYLDCLHLHKVGVDELECCPEIYESLVLLKKEGKVRSLAISLGSPDEALSPQIKQFFDAVQVNFSMLDMRIIKNGFLSNKPHSVGVLARTPLNFGFLASNFPLSIKFDERDHRSNWSRDHITGWIRGANTILAKAGLTKLDETKDRVAYALRFCTSFDAVTSVIPGMLNADEVKQNLRSLKMRKFSSEMIEEIYKEYTAWDSSAAKNRSSN